MPDMMTPGGNGCDTFTGVMLSLDLIAILAARASRGQSCLFPNMATIRIAGRDGRSKTGGFGPFYRAFWERRDSAAQ
jgi:hypothetical protein